VPVSAARHAFVDTRSAKWQNERVGLARSFMLVLVALGATLVASSVRAQEPDAHTEARDTEAHSLFEAGRAAFNDGRYEDARDYFQRSFELSGRGDLLYNIGTAEDRMRQDADALESFRAYLATTPDAPNRTEVEARIAVLEAAVAADEPAAPVEAPPPPRRANGPSITWTWAVGGLALATGALAIAFWVTANDRYGGLERTCLAGGGCTPAEVSASEVETFVTLTNVFFVASMVLTAGTAAALVIELLTPGGSEDASASLRLSPGALRLEGTF
jgi:tetratricopeptide (TPR) repeat protein